MLHHFLIWSYIKVITWRLMTSSGGSRPWRWIWGHILQNLSGWLSWWPTKQFGFGLIFLLSSLLSWGKQDEGGGRRWASRSLATPMAAPDWYAALFQPCCRAARENARTKALFLWRPHPHPPPFFPLLLCRLACERKEFISKETRSVTRELGVGGRVAPGGPQ